MTARLIAAAPDLSRALLAARADTEAAVALVVETIQDEVQKLRRKAGQDADGVRFQALDDVRHMIRQMDLATASGVAKLAALRAEARESAMQALASMGQAQEAYEAQLKAEAERETLTAEVARLRDRERVLVEAGDQAAAFDRADWFWRAMDPDDCGDSPEEAINRAMVGRFCVCEIASSYSGPTRYGFIAPVLDPESDDEEFVHFATQQEAIDAAKARAALAQPSTGDGE